MSNGHVSVSNGHLSKKTPTVVVTEEMVGQGKKQITNLMLKLETPKKYISFK
jgi:hypothetical protein